MAKGGSGAMTVPERELPPDALETARILIVEDEVPVGRIWERALLVAGYERTDSVGTAREAFGRMLRQPYDLIIMDLSLSRDDSYRDGCRAAKAILEQWPETRMLFVSGYDRATAVQIYQCPASMPLIQKPVVVLQAFVAQVAESLILPPWHPEVWPS